MRFRHLPVAAIADIKEMFLLIRIRNEEKHALHFIWRGNDRNSLAYLSTGTFLATRRSIQQSDCTQNATCSAIQRRRLGTRKAQPQGVKQKPYRDMLNFNVAAFHYVERKYCRYVLLQYIIYVSGNHFQGNTYISIARIVYAKRVHEYIKYGVYKMPYCIST